MKKLVAIMLAMLMVLGLSTCAFAEPMDAADVKVGRKTKSC